MESIYTELALYGSKNECARTDTVFLPIAEVCNGTVSLSYSKSVKEENIHLFKIGQQYQGSVLAMFYYLIGSKNSLGILHC